MKILPAALERYRDEIVKRLEGLRRLYAHDPINFEIAVKEFCENVGSKLEDDEVNAVLQRIACGHAARILGDLQAQAAYIQRQGQRIQREAQRR